MLKALKISGNHMFAFTSVPGKGILDLSTPVSKAFNPKSWEDLKGKTVVNESVVLARYGDIRPFANGPVFNCENLFVEECDENFVYYWVNQRTFPKAKNVYLNSHPCEFTVFLRKFEMIYLHESYRRHGHICDEGRNFKVISGSNYQLAISKYEETSEEIKLKE